MNAARCSSSKAKKVDEGLRKHVVVGDVEPGLAAHLVFRMDRLRQVAEAAVGDLAKLVVVVEDHAAVARHAEILEQQVAGKDVGVGEVADALAVVEHRKFGRSVGGAAQVEVERRHAPLDVADDRRSGRRRRRAPCWPSRPQARREAPGRTAPCGKRRRLNSWASTRRPARSCLKTSWYFAHHVLAQDVLRIREAVADDLEDDVEGGQREAHHDETALARQRARTGPRVCQMPQELAVALGLALLGAAEHGEQLARPAYAAAWIQEQHGFADALEIHVKVGAREAEHDADVVFGEHDRIDQHAAVGVLERDDERHEESAARDPPDNVGARHLVEHRHDHLDFLHASAVGQGCAVCAQRPRRRVRRSCRSLSTASESAARRAGPRPRAAASRGWRRSSCQRWSLCLRAGQGRSRRTRCPASTPTVPKSRRVMELKKVLVNSASGSAAISISNCG